MWPLLLLSVISLSVVLERLIFFIREGRVDYSRVLNEMLNLVKASSVSRAVDLGKSNSAVIPRIIAQGLESTSLNFDESVSNACSEELGRYEEGLPILDTAITLAPLLGLLGTVTGMIKSFGLLGASELEAPMAITGGIAEALIATAFGLGIAICALIPFNLLQTRKEKFLREVETKASIFSIHLKQIENQKGSSKAA